MHNVKECLETFLVRLVHGMCDSLAKSIISHQPLCVRTSLDLAIAPGITSTAILPRVRPVAAQRALQTGPSNHPIPPGELSSRGASTLPPPNGDVDYKKSRKTFCTGRGPYWARPRNRTFHGDLQGPRGGRKRHGESAFCGCDCGRMHRIPASLSFTNAKHHSSRVGS